PGDCDRRSGGPGRAAGVALNARRTQRHGAARIAARPRRPDQRAARRLQHDPDSAARRRQRAVRVTAHAAGAAVRPHPAVRLYPAVCADAQRRVALSRLQLHAPASSASSVTDASPFSAGRATARKRVVSGMRPTGRLHLGHLVGALSNWVPLQDQYDCFYFVADWHALTSDYADTSQLTSYAYENVADWIGAGLDPERSTFFIQSLVPEHAELYL